MFTKGSLFKTSKPIARQEDIPTVQKIGVIEQATVKDNIFQDNEDEYLLYFIACKLLDYFKIIKYSNLQEIENRLNLEHITKKNSKYKIREIKTVLNKELTNRILSFLIVKQILIHYEAILEYADCKRYEGLLNEQFIHDNYYIFTNVIVDIFSKDKPKIDEFKSKIINPIGLAFILEKIVEEYYEIIF